MKSTVKGQFKWRVGSFNLQLYLHSTVSQHIISTSNVQRSSERKRVTNSVFTSVQINSLGLSLLMILILLFYQFCLARMLFLCQIRIYLSARLSRVPFIVTYVSPLREWKLCYPVFVRIPSTVLPCFVFILQSKRWSDQTTLQFLIF